MVTDLLDKTKYTGQSFNTGELLQFGQTTMIQLLSQFQDCKTTEFFFAIDNRLSEPSFAYGTLANVATQITTAVGYVVAAQ